MAASLYAPILAPSAASVLPAVVSTTSAHRPPTAVASATNTLSAASGIDLYGRYADPGRIYSVDLYAATALRSTLASQNRI